MPRRSSRQAAKKRKSDAFEKENTETNRFGFKRRKKDDDAPLKKAQRKVRQTSSKTSSRNAAITPGKDDDAPSSKVRGRAVRKTSSRNATKTPGKIVPVIKGGRHRNKKAKEKSPLPAEKVEEADGVEEEEDESSLPSLSVEENSLVSKVRLIADKSLQPLLDEGDRICLERLKKSKQYKLQEQIATMRPMLRSSKICLRKIITAAGKFIGDVQTLESNLVQHAQSNLSALQVVETEKDLLQESKLTLENQVSELERDMQTAAALTGELESQVCSLKSDKERLTKELTTTKETLEEAKIDVESLRESEAKSISEKEKLTTELKAMKETLEKAKADVASLTEIEAKNAKQISQLTELSASTKETADTAGKEVLRLEAELKAAETRAFDAETQISKDAETTSKQIKELTEMLNSAKTTADVAEKDVLRLNGELRAAETRASDAHLQISKNAETASKQINELTEKLTSTKKTADLAEKEVIRLGAELKAAETRAADAQTRLAEAAERERFAEQRISKMEATLDEVRSRAVDDQAVAQADAKESAEKISSQVARIAELEAEKRAVSIALEKLEDAHKSTLKELQTLRQNHSVDKDEQLKRLLDMVKENETLRKEKGSLESNLVSVQNECASASELRIQLQASESSRRELHNRIQELRGNIRVFVRVRPFLGDENKELEATGVRGPPIQTHSNGQNLRVIQPIIANDKSSGSSVEHHKFSFDKVFGEDSAQADVFKEVSELVQSALDGYNVCLFSYGQTGSGKTYTMQGSGKEEGLIGLGIRQVLKTAAKLRLQGWKYELNVTFLEIYNEVIRDLLRDKSEEGKSSVVHAIKTDKNGHKSVTQLKHVPLEREEQVASLLKKANDLRSISSTAMNSQSSRSHSVFTLHLSGEHEESGVSLKGALHLVDLAGSERLSRSKATGAALKEAQSINKSLSCLGDIFLALREKKTHIPYRNSKLTYLLQESFSKDGKTLMIVNVSPTPKSYHETLCSLRFAQNVNQCELGQARAKVSKSKKRKSEEGVGAKSKKEKRKISRR
eukprot:g3664.t1